MTEMKYQQIDITAPEYGVQIDVREDSKVVWITVDGMTVLRICQIPHLELSLPGAKNWVVSEKTKALQKLYGLYRQLEDRKAEIENWEDIATGEGATEEEIDAVKHSP